MRRAWMVMAWIVVVGCAASPTEGTRELGLAEVSKRTGVDLALLVNLEQVTGATDLDAATKTTLLEEILGRHAALRELAVDPQTGDYSAAVNDLYASLWEVDEIPVAGEILDRLGFYENGFMTSMWRVSEYSSCTGCCAAFNDAKVPWTGTLACQCSGPCGGGGDRRNVQYRVE